MENHKNEIVIAPVCPAGTNRSNLENEINSFLRSVGYSAEYFSISESAGTSDKRAAARILAEKGASRVDPPASTWHDEQPPRASN